MNDRADNVTDQYSHTRYQSGLIILPNKTGLKKASNPEAVESPSLAQLSVLAPVVNGRA
jgi:hypothetical protein